MEKEGIDYFNPAIVMALLMAAMSDAAFLTIFFWFVPVVGLVIAALVLGFHYFAAFGVAFLIFPKITKGSLLANMAGTAILDVRSAMLLLAKIILGLAMVLPVPFLALAIIAAIILANKFVQLAASIALVVAAPEAGIPAKAAGAATKGAVTAAKAAEAAETAAVGVEAAGAAAETAEAGVAVGAERVTKETGRVAPETPKEKPPEKPEVPGEALGEEPTEFEKLQKLLRETPPAERKPKTEERENENEGEDEELPKAA